MRTQTKMRFDRLECPAYNMPRTTALAKASVTKEYSDFHRQERAERFAKIGY
jgi:hypothetical protein